MNNNPAESELQDRPKSAPRFTYASGTQPLDGYTIKRGVGRGGFGEVYYALSDAGKEVALKLIRRNLDVEIRGVTHCLNLKHPNLVALYDIRTDEHDDRWVVMEYVSGESLEDVIDRHPNGMPLDLALRWFAGVAAGVGYLHEHGIVHRDLKPANIFMDEGTVKIGDYGLSKFISCSRRSGQTESVGTVHYMAPEIANGRYGREIDTYALGIILYEMLTGHVPFQGESVGEVLMKHLTAEPDLSSLEEPYRTVVRGAMAKDPELRISSVSEMLATMGIQGQGTYGASISRDSHYGEASDGSPNARETVLYGPLFSSSKEEPLWAKMKSLWHQLREELQLGNMHPFPKAIVIFVFAVFALMTSQIWFPVLFFGGIVYCVYRVIWSITSKLQPTEKQSHPRPADPLAPPAGARPQNSDGPRRYNKRGLRLSWQERVRQYLATKSPRERSAELVGAMFLAGIVSAVATLMVCLITMQPVELEVYLWLTIVVTIACWAIMIPAKLLEGRVEDQAPMRSIQFVSGAFVGVAAWALARWMMVPVFAWNKMGIPAKQSITGDVLGLNFGRADGSLAASVTQMPVQVFAAYFAFLFLLLAWWRQAEISRNTRVSIWSISWCFLVAYMLHFVWWFPQPLGMMVAALTAFSIQFASPWLSPTRRRELLDTGAAH